MSLFSVDSATLEVNFAIASIELNVEVENHTDQHTVYSQLYSKNKVYGEQPFPIF